MKALLDTHAFLWWSSGDKRLSPRARRAMADPRNDIRVSVVTAWELIAKIRAGRFTLDESPATFIRTQLAANDFRPLAVNLDHSLALADIPLLHQDPFDRLLVAQAMVEDLHLITRDRAIARYPIRTFW